MNVPADDIAALYQTEVQRLRAFVRRIIGCHGAAEDVVQQAFANLLRKGASDEQLNRGYVTQAVHNLALNHLRDTRRRAEVELTGVETEHIADSRPSPERIVSARRELQRLLQAIAALPERRRQAFVLKRLEGLSYEEIAERMGTTRNTVISQVVAAMAQLDALLERA
ncbi:RNA polymerase sigma factor [Bordetella genomosp. 12]|uniref:RNA polymerase subunit sigma-70 n=1 Tax=Bordetella genomosp. 12 TaxID=463035 RepID=A0A261VDB6_9BORD|nr:sigma-70 family RNA polymerase sigma factor [Bordetella genomosp. 12]OZI71580.1 RNA polymerase subunit sigma-70 [Bordetella genomosp. 12]